MAKELNFADLPGLVAKMHADEESVEVLGKALGYEVGKNPIDPDGETKIYFSDRAGYDVGVMATVIDPDLNQKSSTVQVRKLYQKVLDLNNEFVNGDFSVQIIAFIGEKRLVFFPTVGGNRDVRLDVTEDTAKLPLYQNDFSYLTNQQIVVDESIFGFGTEITVKDHAFRRELSDHFLYTVSFYRKKISEWITATDVKKLLAPLLSDDAKYFLEKDDLNNLVQCESYKSVLSTVVDTITLRQLMRRFLEGYYGADTFNVNGISLGVGNGTLDDAIEQAVNVAKHIGDINKIKKLNQKKTPIHEEQMALDLFDDEEKQATSEAKIKEGKEGTIAELTKKAQEQFQLAYGGDLFAGSVGKVANEVEQELSKEDEISWSKIYVDTKAGNYSFRFEDMPPEALEKQYEDSMSRGVQITLEKEEDPKTHRIKQEPVIYYGDDDVEQKNKGAYYTRQEFVSYMVEQTVSKEFNERYALIKEAVNGGDIDQIEKAIDHLLDLKIADFSCGGGSFLRGAFLELAEKYKLLNLLDYPDEIRQKYNFLSGQEDSQYQWEDYVLKHMIYGVDIDYKAIIIASLTLTLSGLENRPKNTKLPELIGRTLIHQNSLICSVPYYVRKEVYSKHKKAIANLRKYKYTDFDAFLKLKNKLQAQVASAAGKVSQYSKLLNIEAIELNLPEIYFNEDGTLNEHGGMDIVIGNPPWEVWKPNSDEFFSQYDPSFRKLGNKKDKNRLQAELFKQVPKLKEKWEKEKERIKAGSQYIKSNDAFRYQTWEVNGRKTSADLNLYKVALERFIQLAKRDGRFSILVPDNFATDNGSTGLRHLVIDNYHMEEFLSFENRKGIFPAVDSRYKFACLTFDGEGQETKDFKAFFYRHDLKDLKDNTKKLTYPIDFLKEMEPERYAMVEATSEDRFDIFHKIRSTYPALRETKLLSWRNDFHKTNDADKFIKLEENPGVECIPLYEGKYMNQFAIYPDKIEFGVLESDVKDKVGDDYLNYRIAIRAVGSSTNQRTLIATLLPRNVTSAHSLFVQRDVLDTAVKDQLFDVGMLNSYVLDYVLRNLVTMNVSLIYLQQLPLPKYADLLDSDDIVQITKELLKENKGYYEELDTLIPGDKYANTIYEDLEFDKNDTPEMKKHKSLVAELNARVMLDYNLSHEEIVKMMETFESEKHKDEVRKETQRILNRYEHLLDEV